MSSKWANLNLSLPLIIPGFKNALEPMLELLRSLLQIVKSALLMAQAFVHGYLDPINALVNAIITEVRNLLKDLEAIGIYITGDWLYLNDTTTFYQGFQGFQNRCVTALMDENDVTRPQTTESTTVYAVFLVVNNPLTTTIKRAEDYLVKTIEGLLQLTHFFNVETAHTNPRAKPIVENITYSPNDTRGPWTATPRADTTHLRIKLAPTKIGDNIYGDGYGKYIVSQTKGATMPVLMSDVTAKPVMASTTRVNTPVTWLSAPSDTGQKTKPLLTTQELVTATVEQARMGYVIVKRHDLSSTTVTVGVQNVSDEIKDSDLLVRTDLDYDNQTLQTLPAWVSLASDMITTTLTFPVNVTTAELENAKLAALNALLVEVLTTTKPRLAPKAPVDFEASYIVSTKRKEADVLLAKADSSTIKLIAGQSTQNLRTTNLYALTYNIQNEKSTLGKPGVQQPLEKDMRDSVAPATGWWGAVNNPMTTFGSSTQSKTDYQEAQTVLTLLRKGQSPTSYEEKRLSQGRWSRVTLGDLMPFLHPFLHLMDDYLASLIDATKGVADLIDMFIEKLIARIDQLDAFLATLDKLLADIDALIFSLPTASISVLTTVALGTTGTVNALLQAQNKPLDTPLFLNASTGSLEGSQYEAANVPMAGCIILASTLPALLFELIGASTSMQSEALTALAQTTDVSSSVLQDGFDVL